MKTMAMYYDALSLYDKRAHDNTYSRYTKQFLHYLYWFKVIGNMSTEDLIRARDFLKIKK